MGSRCVKSGVVALTLSHTGPWKFNLSPHGKELSKDLRVSLSVLSHTLHTASNWSAWLFSQKDVSSEDDAQEILQKFAEDKQSKDMDYLNHVLGSDGINV
ncbi:hypothetical protein CHARACLAT_006146 [Characodon lateralis]|uniref:Uncharacterized protein n=1 Tax=Characodon lateralis TaxID=208331 RepID=A0ABU7DNR8_9TELE|nr:hypothetical protein [Characodon lateralis]